jgi:predicted aldo/keto reductase-like oxidoreductase
MATVIFQPNRADARRRGGKHALQRRKLGKTREHLSLIGFGGIVVMKMEQSAADRVVHEALDRGVNYFDVAPTYGDAQERLGPALEGRRDKVFLACKTVKRDAKGAEEELHASLKTLRTDHFDLYQLHGLRTMEELEQCLKPGGALEAILAAREAGKVRYIGFSAHSVKTALAAMDRFEFDTVLFPVNYVLYARANFGPQVVAKAQEKGMGCLALKSMALTTSTPESRKQFPKCWYMPISDPHQASLAVRFTLSERVTALLPPGDEYLFRLALEAGEKFSPLAREERDQLLASAEGLEPIFQPEA